LEKGALADLMLVDTTGLVFVPQISPLANFIYAANSSCIDTLICNGKVLMRHRVVEGEEEILAQAREYAKYLLR
ncbi:MAG: amidohydrolase, partial [Candidatus Egerieousia sp.]|nr:amidohydrolase [Candidatus Egerieousia sp.]